MLDCFEITGISFLLLITSLILTSMLTYALIRFSHKKKVYDYPDARKRHEKPMPFLGGVGVFFSFWIIFSVFLLFCKDLLLVEGPFYQAFLISSTVIFLSGLIDDFVDLKFYIKLLAQVIAALILIYYGFYFDRLYFPFWRSFHLGWASFPITVLWVVLLTNSINLIDGMDGLASTIGLTVCLGLLFIAALLEIPLITIISVILAGCMLGFLFFNRPPAKIYLGDSGALFVGFVFSVAAIVCPIKSLTAISMFVPLVAVSLPLLEIATTVIRRVWIGRKIYMPDNRHIFNYLMQFGFSEKTVLLILGLISLLFNAFIPALFWFDRRQVFSIFVLFLISLFGIFFILKLIRGAGKV
jgi:UDP-GlcNAc:undecaprenyl-phosphate GlcNAc-1-phosphate transferase